LFVLGIVILVRSGNDWKRFSFGSEIQMNKENNVAWNISQLTTCTLYSLFIILILDQVYTVKWWKSW